MKALHLTPWNIFSFFIHLEVGIAAAIPTSRWMKMTDIYKKRPRIRNKYILRYIQFEKWANSDEPYRPTIRIIYYWTNFMQNNYSKQVVHKYDSVVQRVWSHKISVHNAQKCTGVKLHNNIYYLSHFLACKIIYMHKYFYMQFGTISFILYIVFFLYIYCNCTPLHVNKEINTILYVSGVRNRV